MEDLGLCWEDSRPEAIKSVSVASFEYDVHDIGVGMDIAVATTREQRRLDFVIGGQVSFRSSNATNCCWTLGNVKARHATSDSDHEIPKLHQRARD